MASLALAASAILTVGWALRPREVSSAPVPTETELTQLARRAERRTLDSMTSYFASTAQTVAPSIVHLPAIGASGVVWRPDIVVTAPIERHVASLAMHAGPAEARVDPVLWGPRLPLSSVTTPGGSLEVSPVERAESQPAPGAWVLAVWGSGAARGFAPASYVQSLDTICGTARVQELVTSPAWTQMMVGGGLFDIDGRLLAVILPCNNRIAAIAASSVDSILAAPVSSDQRILALYGLTFAACTPAEQDYFKVAGCAIAREVWLGQRGAQAGLIAGDIILELDGMPVTTPADLGRLASVEGDLAIPLTVRRGSRMLKLTLPPEVPPTDAGASAESGTGLVMSNPRAVYTIESVLPGSRAAVAGLEPDDQLIRINYVEPRNLAQVQRVLTGNRTMPVLLEVQRGDRRVAMLLR